MAFDHNSVPKDLRPLNVATRTTISEEPRTEAATHSTVAPPPVTAMTTARNPEFFVNPDESIYLFYPATVSDAGFVGVDGYGNPGPAPRFVQWGSFLPVRVGNANVAMNPPASGLGYSPVLGSRVIGNATDHSSNDMAAGLSSTLNLGSQVTANENNELTSVGFSHNPSFANRGRGSGTDRGSEEGGDDSVSRKKVKFLCSFGGKILPRPSDNALRYVGGQTRIVSVRRDVNFNELSQKMIDTYGQQVVIKYQLPGEDLDALVSVSCLDDLDNMMDEYEKLVERSLDGSAKLRVFLFSTTELDASGMLQFGDLHDTGQRYVDAVNGILDSSGGGGGNAGGINRKQSIASATSTQNSDVSGAEGVDSSGHGQGDVNIPPSANMFSSKGDLDTSHESNGKVALLEPNHPVYADASTVSLDIPVFKTGSSHKLSSQAEVEFESPVSLPQQQVGYDFQPAGMGISAPAAHSEAYVGPPEITNPTDYMHLPPQMGFPNSHFLGTAGTVFTRQQIHDGDTGVTAHHFVPAAHTTITNPSSHVSIRSAVVQPLMQPQPRLEHYPDENTVGTRIVHLPLDLRYKVYQALNPTTIPGGCYLWHQVPQLDHVVLRGRSVAKQQVILPEKIPRLEDCYMCQKTLPHAHSDPAVQDQRESGVDPLSDSNSVDENFHFEDIMKAWPVKRVMPSRTLGEGFTEQSVRACTVAVTHADHQPQMPPSEANVFSKNFDALQENVMTAFQKMESFDQPKILSPQAPVGLAADRHSPYGVFVGAIPHLRQEDSIQQHSMPVQYQFKQAAEMNKTIDGEVPNVAGQPTQASEHLVHEFPKEFSSRISPIGSKEEDVVTSCLLHEQPKPFDGMMEALSICPSEMNVHSEQIHSTAGKFRKEEILDHVMQQMAGRDVFLNNTFNNPELVLDSNHIRQTEVLPSSAEVPHMQDSQPLASSEIIQSPHMCNPGPYLHSKIGIQLLDSMNPAFSSVESAYVADRIPPVGFKKDALKLLRRVVPNEVEAVSSASTLATLSPSGVGNFQDSSSSLFYNQDPWNLRHDTDFPPPRPSKIRTKKEAFTKEQIGTNHLRGPADFIAHFSEDGIPQPINNSNFDFRLENTQSSKGSAEDLIKQELQAVAEGVATSVFQSPSPSYESPMHERNESVYEADHSQEFSYKEVEMLHKAKFEEMKKKLPEKVNFGFPVSEGIGRLQIIKNSDLEELQELGSGTFGTVYHGKWRGSDVAIKRINDRCFGRKSSEQERMIHQIDDFWNEVIKLADLHHPNVVAFYGVVLDGPGGSVATVTEYMVNGSLGNALQKTERSLDKRKRLLIAMDVAFGMEYLHGKNIVHFDLKSDNLLVNLRDTHRPICKVGDLGLSKVKCQTLISGGVRGTLPWMAPELLNGSSSLVSEKVDVFSFGIVLWELLTGEEPYADLHYGAIIGGIVSNTLRPAVPDSCDADWKSLMERCWSPEPWERPSFTEIANDLRAMSATIPPKGQSTAQQIPSTQAQIQK